MTGRIEGREKARKDRKDRSRGKAPWPLLLATLVAGTLALCGGSVAAFAADEPASTAEPALVVTPASTDEGVPSAAHDATPTPSAAPDAAPAPGAPRSMDYAVTDVAIQEPGSSEEVANELLSGDGTTLYVGTQTGVTLGFTLRDGSGAAVTGATVPSVQVGAVMGGSLQAHTATWSAAAGCYQVTIAPRASASSLLDVTRLTFSVDPTYGTVFSTDLSTLGSSTMTPLGIIRVPLTSISFVDEGVGCSVTLRNGTAPLASDGATNYLSSLSGTAAVTDPVAQLLLDAPGINVHAALGSLALSVELRASDGTTLSSTSLPLASLTAAGGDAWTTEVASPPSEGAHTYTLAYHHDLNGVYGFGAGPATTTATYRVLYDTSFSQASVPVLHLPDAGATPEVQSQTTEGGTVVDYLVNAGNRLVIGVADDAGGSGLDPATLRLSYQRRDATMGNPQGGTLSLGSGIEWAGGDEYVVTLPDGIYLLDELTFTASDRAGNALGSGVHASCAVEGSSFDALLCDDFPKSADTRLGVTEGSGRWTDVTGVADTLMVTTGGGASAPTITAWVRDPGLFDFFSGYLQARPAVVTLTYTDPGGAATGPVTYAADTLSALPRGRHGRAITLDRGPGKYAIDVSYRGASRSWTVFYGTGGSSLVDVKVATTAGAPSFVARYDADGDTAAHADFVSYSPVVRLTVPNPMDGLLPWNLGEQEVTVEGVRWREAEGDAWQDLATPLSARRGSSRDLYEVVPPTAGEYDLSHATVRVTDPFGVRTAHDLGPFLPTAVDGVRDLTTVVRMDAWQMDPRVTVSVSDAEDGVPAVRDGYHRGSMVATVTVTGDPYLDLYQHSTTAATDRLVLDCDDCRGGTQTFQRDVRGYLPTTVTNADGSVTKGWAATVSLPDTSLPQGVYRYSATHNWLDGSAVSPVGSFVLDSQPPVLGDLELSVPGATIEDPGGPVERWGILFYSRPMRIARTASDIVSGVDPDSARASLVPDGGRAARFDSASGRLLVDLPDDNDRLVLDRSSMTVSDLAGNVATDADGTLLDFLRLVQAGRSNVDPSATEVVVDTEAPVLALSFDNDDVRNGRYYNAGRTGTLTLAESTFDLVRANDSQLQVATVTHDGSTSVLTAGDFQNPSGDGRTWVAAIDATQDGDWDVSARYTDVVDHASNEVSASFTVDTVAPVMTVSFDNDDARNGFYYNRPRTATVRACERNFSPDLASVTASAADASGTAASAPGASGWSPTGEQYTQASTVHFGDELHYTLQASMTDLAGNAAVTYEVPEFVIDMTSPAIDIEDVADRTAYAGTIAPRVSMRDTNYSLSESKVSLVGAHAGERDYLPGMSRERTDTGESVTYVDFEHKLAYDDVYTLAAQATDLAGNSVREERTFSVNRFGSNYVYSDATAALRGTYLRVPQDVSVTEINVSGLDDTQTHAELVVNDEVRDLALGEDVRVEKSDDDGWDATTYTIPAAEFSDDAYYRLLLSSHDLAGNLSQNLMDGKDADRSGVASVEFAVDGTAPTGGFVGVTQGAVYFGPDRDALPRASDNMALGDVQVSMDGGEPVRYDAGQAEAGRMSLVVPADAHPHDLTIAVRDRAGNVRTQEVRDVMVAADWGQYLLNNPGALFAVVGGAIATAGLATIALASAVRHHRMSEGTRNPFGH